MRGLAAFQGLSRELWLEIDSRDLTIAWASNNCLKLCATPKDEIVGTCFLDAIPEEEHAEVRQMFATSWFMYSNALANMLGGIPQSMVPTIRGAYTRLRPTSPCRVRADVQVIVNNPKNQRAPPPGGLTTEQRRILQHFSAVDHQLGVGVPGDAFGPFQPPVVPFTSQAPGSFGTFQQPAHMQYAAGMASPAVGAQHGGWLQQMPAPVRDTNRGTGAVRFAVLETIIDEGAGTR